MVPCGSLVATYTSSSNPALLTTAHGRKWMLGKENLMAVDHGRTRSQHGLAHLVEGVLHARDCRRPVVAPPKNVSVQAVDHGVVDRVEIDRADRGPLGQWSPSP